ncbi:hypothetical protein [Nitrosomonas sp.]|uniref:hypothetical protein n=1 Tax=Nitrosomonas sp. TaxID=42353 RepID=UPI0025D70906|nr:hypothetical protein [Nitrosomonas sp.]
MSLLKSASEKNSQGFIAKKNQTFNQKLFPNENLGKKKMKEAEASLHHFRVNNANKR